MIKKHINEFSTSKLDQLSTIKGGDSNINGNVDISTIIEQGGIINIVAGETSISGVIVNVAGGQTAIAGG